MITRTLRREIFMKRRLLPLLLVLLTVTSPVILAEESPSNPLSRLDRNDVVDAFQISNLIYIFKTSQLPKDAEIQTELSKLLPAGNAADLAEPHGDILMLTEQFLGFSTSLKLASASAINSQNGFYWKITWICLPDEINLSGTPYRFHAMVKPDGSLMIPERHLCCQTTLEGIKGRAITSDGKPEHSPMLFSTLSFEDLKKSKEEASLHGDEIQNIATKTFRDFIEKNIPDRPTFPYRFRSQSIIELPVGMIKKQQIQYQKVWAVDFIPSDCPADSILEMKPFTIWVTPDGFPSTLSLQGWKAENRRPEVVAGGK